MIVSIIIFAFGVLIGNFTTTVLYRLPRGIILYGFNKQSTQPPFCSSCAHPLKFYEYLPVLSWVSTFGNCNYCRASIPAAYFFLEVSAGFMAILCSFFYADDIENYLIVFCFCTTALLAMAILFQHSVMPKPITTCLIFEAVLYRTLNDASILPWFTAFGIAAILSIYILKNDIDNLSKQTFIHWFLPASVWLEIYELLLIMPILLFFFIRNVFVSSRNLYIAGMSVLIIKSIAFS